MMVSLFWLTLGLDVLSEFGRVQDLSEKSEESHEAVGPRGSITAMAGGGHEFFYSFD